MISCSHLPALTEVNGDVSEAVAFVVCQSVGLLALGHVRATEYGRQSISPGIKYCPFPEITVALAGFFAL